MLLLLLPREDSGCLGLWRSCLQESLPLAVFLGSQQDQQTLDFQSPSPDSPSSTTLLSTSCLFVPVSVGAAKFGFAYTVEKPLASFGRERTFLKTADGIWVLERDNTETYPCFWHFPWLVQQTALCGSCFKACCSHASLWERRPLYLGCCEFPMATQHLKVGHGLMKCSNALESFAQCQSIMDKGRSGKEIYAVGVIRLWQIHGCSSFCSLFLQNRFTLPYFEHFISFKQQCSLREMNGCLRRVSLLKEIAEGGKWEHLCFGSHRSGMYLAEFCSSTVQKYTNKHVLFTHRITVFVQLGREAGREWPDREGLFVLFLPLANTPPLDSSSVYRRAEILCWKVQSIGALQPVLQAWSRCMYSMGLTVLRAEYQGFLPIATISKKKRATTKRLFFFFPPSSNISK